MRGLSIGTLLIVSALLVARPAWPQNTFSLAQCLAYGQGTSYRGMWSLNTNSQWRAEQCAQAEAANQLRMRSQAEDEAQQKQWEKQKERDRREMNEWNRRAAEASKPRPALLVQPTFIQVNPRLSGDRATLTLVDEVREPADKRQPEIQLGGDPTTKSRFLRVSGKGLVPPATVQIICGSTPRSLPLTAFARHPEINSGTYEVRPDTAAAVIGSESCFLSFAGALLPLPRDLTAVVWAQSGVR